MGKEYILKRMDRLIRPENTGIERFIHAVTYQCNSKCTMCNIWQIDYTDGKLRAQELTTQDLDKMFSDQEMFKNVTDIGLTGGEPLLHPNLEGIAKFYLKRFPQARISINTNALQPEKCVKVLKNILDREPNPDRFRVSFSLDGIGDVHNSIRGIPGNYEKVLKNLSLVQEENLNIELAFTMTLLPENYTEVLKVWMLAKEQGVGFSFAFPQTSGSFYQNKDAQFHFSEEMLDQIQDQVDEIQKLSASFNNFYYDGMVGYQRDKKEVVRCYAGRNSFFLDPKGDVYSCILLEKPFGNVKEKTFKDVWTGEKAEEIRQWIWKTHCNCWGCESEVSFRRSWKVAVHGLKKKLLS